MTGVRRAFGWLFIIGGTFAAWGLIGFLLVGAVR
jgi:hypothetical protein